MIRCNPDQILNPVRQYKLKRSMCIPSLSHTEAVCTDYIKRYILSKIGKDFFKVVYINDSFVINEYKKLTDINTPKDLLAKDKPALAITPKINMDFDRDLHNNNMFGDEVVINRGQLDTCFIRDWDKNLFTAIGLKLCEVGYDIKMLVHSKSQQIDLHNKLLHRFPIGCTSWHKVDLDMHIPTELMNQLAHDVGYDISKDSDCMEFVRYLNSKSQLPILHKYRRATGTYDFFVRMPKYTLRIDMTDNINPDDGERNGFVEDNFILDFSIRVQIPAPKWYMYFSNEDHYIIDKFSNDGESLAFETIVPVHVPEMDEHGWNNYRIMEYIEEDLTTPLKIDLNGLFDSLNISHIIKQSLTSNISPRTFFNCKVYNADKEYNMNIDWTTGIGTFDELFTAEKTYITLYIDTAFVHNQNIIYNKLNDTRIKDIEEE